MQYSVPQYVFLENISKHKVSTVSGESMREYAKSQSASVGLDVDAMFFSGSVNSSFNESSSGSERHFYYTYRDANTKWRVSFDERDYDNLDKILDPRFKKDLEEMDPEKLFSLYGTHYIASAYLGGRADFNTITVVTSQTNTSELEVAIKAKYHSVSGSSDYKETSLNAFNSSNTTSKLTVTGGNSESVSDISNPEMYEKWASGIAEMPVLCDFDENSLKPIWDFCTNADRKAQLKAEFAKMIAAHPLPEAMSGAMKVGNQVYFISSVANSSLYFDIPNYHLNAERKNGTPVNVGVKDNQEAGLQGIDRFIKVVAHATEYHYVFLQPQHSDLVFDIQGGSTDAGTPVQLYGKGNDNLAQMFKLIEVDNRKNTYFIQNKNSGLYLTSHGSNQQITQEKQTKAENQQWKFESASAQNMASMNTDMVFAIQNVMGKRYVDLRNEGRDAELKGGWLILWDMNNTPDQFSKLHKSNVDGYYYIQQMHSNFVWDIVGGQKDNGTKLQLYDRNNSEAQQFKFVYAGDAMTFKIQNRGSSRFVDASSQGIDQNGCIIQIYDEKDNQNQKWKLEPVGIQSFVPKQQKVKIQVRFSGDKYWDLDGDGNAVNNSGTKLQIWDWDNNADRFFEIKSSGDGAWVWLELQGGKRIDVRGGNVGNNGSGLQVYEPNNDDGQKFEIKPTSRTTCVLLTKGGKALDVSGGEVTKNGAELILWDLHYGISQQFTLIDADSGRPIDFREY